MSEAADGRLCLRLVDGRLCLRLADGRLCPRLADGRLCPRPADGRLCLRFAQLREWWLVEDIAHCGVICTNVSSCFTTLSPLLFFVDTLFFSSFSLFDFLELDVRGVSFQLTSDNGCLSDDVPTQMNVCSIESSSSFFIAAFDPTEEEYTNNDSYIRQLNAMWATLLH